MTAMTSEADINSQLWFFVNRKSHTATRNRSVLLPLQASPLHGGYLDFIKHESLGQLILEAPKRDSFLEDFCHYFCGMAAYLGSHLHPLRLSSWRKFQHLIGWQCLAMLSSCFQRCEKWNKPVLLMRHLVINKSNPWKLFSRGGFYCKWATTSVPTFVKLWPRQWQVLTYRGWMIQQVHIRSIGKITIMTSVTLTNAPDTCREDSIAI